MFWVLTPYQIHSMKVLSPLLSVTLTSAFWMTGVQALGNLCFSHVSNGGWVRAVF